MKIRVTTNNGAQLYDFLAFLVGFQHFLRVPLILLAIGGWENSRAVFFSVFLAIFESYQVDLEDRQMALMYKRLRSASSSPWIQTRLSPSEALEVTTEVNHQHHWGRTTWCDPTKVRGDVPAMNGDFIAKLRETLRI